MKIWIKFRATYFSPCEWQSCKENEWKVLIVSSLAIAFPVIAPIRSLISEAAAVVNVIARMFDELMPCLYLAENRNYKQCIEQQHLTGKNTWFRKIGLDGQGSKISK